LCTANAPSDFLPTVYDTSALSSFSETGKGFDMDFEKSSVKKKAVCSACGGQGHNKRSCFNIMNLR
jgi:hypothetical protein